MTELFWGEELLQNSSIKSGTNRSLEALLGVRITGKRCALLFFFLLARRYTGALYGRIIGLILVSIFGVQNNKYGAWIDPGLFAAIGAASFFSGVSRLTISLTVIMVSMLNFQVFVWLWLS